MKKYNLTFVFVLFSIGAIFAQNDSTKVKKLYPRPPIYGIPAKTLPKGKIIYRSYFTFSDYAMKYNVGSQQMVELPDGMSFRSFSYTPKFRYGLTNKFTMIANFPMYYKQMDNNGMVMEGLGFGDMILAGLYKFYHNKPKQLIFSGLLFTKYPTGKSSNLKIDELPLGTGSYDGGIAILPEKEFGELDLRLSAFYIFRSANRDNVDLGDVQNYSVSAAYNFSKKFIAETTVLYKSIANNEKNGKVLPDTYSKLSQLIVGAQYRLAHSFLIQAAIPVTLYAKTPFSSNYNLWLGIYYLW